MNRKELHGMHPVRPDEAKRVLIDGLINGSAHEEKYVCVNDGACVWMCMYLLRWHTYFHTYKRML